jgi:superfamily II DNA helicase RecQ
LPTGAGKSLGDPLTAQMLADMMSVVSPLMALM